MKTYVIYNIVAEICSHIIKNCEEDFFVKYSCVSKEERTRSRDIIKENIPSLFKGEEIVKITQENLDNELIRHIEALISKLIFLKDYYCLISLAQTLDEALSLLLLSEIHGFEQESFTTVLNTNRETTGIGLLPRCSCVWERKRRLSHCYNRMDNFMYHFLIMENTILGELVDKHIFLKPDIFPNFREKKALKIAATPLSIKRDHKFIYLSDEKVQYVSLEYFEKEYEHTNKLILKKILIAGENECDIAVFPEIMANPETESYIVDKIKKLSSSEQKKLPSFIILPSLFEGKSNTVTVINNKGNIIAKQKKQNPFREYYKGDNYLEEIIPSMVVNIFHYEGIGRIAVLICKDFLTTKYLEQLMRCFKLTLIIVPSFSTGSYDFVQSFDLCAHDDCNVVWINTCAAVEDGKENNFKHIGYVRKRISRYDDESQKLCEMASCSGFTKGLCNEDCIFFETMGMV
ncbi:MAG: carbon-nitrogen hydrolase family protein [Firmicutes bacterium]|nr:carbon-nitrogen hydrolase family protein [Bacillota bacterium]